MFGFQASDEQMSCPCRVDMDEMKVRMDLITEFVSASYNPGYPPVSPVDHLSIFPHNAVGAIRPQQQV